MIDIMSVEVIIMKTLIFGHKNPDTDSVCSAIAYSYLKNSMNEDTEPRILGEIKNEAKYVLDYFKLPYPEILYNVKSQLKDASYHKSLPIDEHNSYLKAFKTMDLNALNTIAITDKDNYLTGILSIKDIAMELIKGDFKNLNSVFNNIVVQIDAKILVCAGLNESSPVVGNISVATNYYKSLNDPYNENDIVITGDVFPLIEKLLEYNVGLVIICSETLIPDEIINTALADALAKLNL